ncbi:MAG: glycosyltransferase family 92 protein [Pseudomonadota bacterium]
MSQIKEYQANNQLAKRRILNKILGNICCGLIPSKIIRQTMRHNARYGISLLRAFDIIRYRNFNNFTYLLSIIACLKNEAPYVCEWIEYYKLMGVEHFYLYNNNSTDNIDELLEPYIYDGTVTLIDYPGLGVQAEMYNHALNTYRLKSKWFAIVDLDEFIVPKKYPTILDLLQRYEEFSQLEIQWHLFGNAGHINKPQGLVIENFTLRGLDAARLGKSIFQSIKTYIASVHNSYIVGDSKKITIDEVQCNHYFTKSEEEYFTSKVARGNATIYQPDRHNRTMFDAHNKNEVYDDTMLQYVDKIKTALAEKNRL